MTARAQRLAWIVVTAGLLAALLALDAHRGGPATPLSRCNLALTRSSDVAADVLVVGSSRTGTVIDPVAMESMIGAEPGFERPTIERIALARNPLRPNVALLENYLALRGRPKIIIFEITFLTARTIERIDDLTSGLAAEAFLFRRDVNLMRYHQILTMPSVAMPYTEQETVVNRLRYALRGTVLRSGALAYQLAHEPGNRFSIDDCDVETWTRESTWPTGFAFSWNETDEIGRPADRIESLLAELAAGAATRTLRDWQVGVPTDLVYPYDFDEPYRAGELALLDQAVGLAAARGIPVVLLPLPVYGSRPSIDDLTSLEARFGDDALVYDVYGAAGVDLSRYWYDDAHLEVRTAGELTTALVAQHLIDGALSGAGEASGVARSPRRTATRSSG